MEFESGEKFLELGSLAERGGTPLGIEVDGGRVVEPGESAAEHRLLLVGDDGLGRLGRNVAEPLARRLQDALQAPVAAQQLRGADRPDPGDAGDVVGDVAYDGQVIGHLFRAHLELLHDLPGIVDHVLGLVEDLDAVVDELQGVLVSAHQDDPEALASAASGHGGQKVVRLESRSPQGRQAHGPDHLLGQAQLLDQRGLRLLPRGLVLPVELMPEGGAGGIEADHQVRGGLPPDEGQEHPGEPEEGPYRLPPRRGQRGQGMISPMQIGVGVDYIKELIGSHARRGESERRCVLGGPEDQPRLKGVHPGSS